ncbi:heme peroxidase [Polyplosphaeria fusca]|uniref:Peroxidase n=1 Tax=Polyplosphaeria fusca TaxID=682080 RepID=A0A9P4QMH0_9PLEO|nr:heme peroxidase [Polyplosphaeria fusca]
MTHYLLVLLASTLTRTTTAAFYYPDPQSHLLEHILVDNWGAYASNFSSAITPCTNYVSQRGSTGLNSGRTTAAQWMRVLFHDFITANVSAGTGGIDASIGFETSREENKGSAFNDSFAFWAPYVNEYVPMADLVALGTVMSNNLCGSRLMPYQPGRIDATAAGHTTGVPAPETDLEETLLFFDRAGFNETDSIALTACGHTLGSVHHGGFPEVVDDSTVTPTNTNGGANFDSTRGIFDPLVVSEYLSSTGEKGGPLVTSFNVSSRSDLRLYESDGNATMQALLKQGDGFLDTCVDLFKKVVNTVPSHVTLKEEIQLMEVKPVNVTFGFDKDDKLILTGTIRILTPAGSRSPKTLEFSIAGKSYNLQSDPETGTSVFGRSGSEYGTLSYFSFSIPGSKARKETSFSVLGHSFSLQSETFIYPDTTMINGAIVNASIATSTSTECGNLKVTIAVPYKQQGTLAPKVQSQQITLNSKSVEKDGFKICSGIAELENVPTGLVSLKVFTDGKVADVLLVNGGAAGW